MIQLLKSGGRAGIVLPDGSLTGDGVKERIREKFLTDCNLHTIIRMPVSVFKPYATVPTNLLFFTKTIGATSDLWLVICGFLLIIYLTVWHWLYRKICIVDGHNSF